MRFDDNCDLKGLPGNSEISSNDLYWNLARPFYVLSQKLSYMNQQDAALKAIQEAAELYQQLAADQPAAFNPNLAMAFNILSNHLSDLGHRDDALKAIQEAVELYQQLAADQPAAFNPDLADSLNNLSVHLSVL